MKHPASRELYARWLAARQHPREPAAARGYRFVVAADPAAGFPLRGIGTDFETLLGPGIKDRPFPGLFVPASRRTVTEILTVAATEALATVAGLTARQGRHPVALELLILPPSGRGLSRLSSGLLIPLAATGCAAVDGLAVASWRHLHPPAPPRALHKITVAPGMVLYEGRSRA